MEYGKLFHLDGKIALVVGGYGAIGSEICRGLAQYGASIVVSGRDGGKARGFAEDLEARGWQATAIRGDITQSSDAKRIVQEVIDRFGRIDIMINSTGTHVDAPAEELKEEDWDRVLGVTLKGAFLIAQAAGKAMIAQGRGKIITISSVRSQLAIRRGYAAYTSAKGGVNMLTKQLATEWAKYHINVNAIAPTFIRTASVAQYLTNKEFYDALVNRIPLARVGETEDLVGAALFFSSSASDFVTGQILFVDGGVTACQ
jgi:gluconate 5-dehydrogenase